MQTIPHNITNIFPSEILGMVFDDFDPLLPLDRRTLKIARLVCHIFRDNIALRPFSVAFFHARIHPDVQDHFSHYKEFSSDSANARIVQAVSRLTIGGATSNLHRHAELDDSGLLELIHPLFNLQLLILQHISWVPPVVPIDASAETILRALSLPKSLPKLHTVTLKNIQFSSSSTTISSPPPHRLQLLALPALVYSDSVIQANIDGLPRHPEDFPSTCFISQHLVKRDLYLDPPIRPWLTMLRNVTGLTRVTFHGAILHSSIVQAMQSIIAANLNTLESFAIGVISVRGMLYVLSIS